MIILLVISIRRLITVLFHRRGTVSPWGKTGRSYRWRNTGCLTLWWNGSSCSCRNGSGRLNSGSWILSGFNFGVWKCITVCVAVDWLASQLNLKHIIFIQVALCTNYHLDSCCLVVTWLWGWALSDIGLDIQDTWSLRWSNRFMSREHHRDGIVY